MENTQTMSGVSKHLGRKNIIIVLVVLFLAAAGTAAYFYNQLRISREDPQAKAQQEAVDLAARVGMLIVLPTDEVPTIATVADPDKLKDEAFFANAKVGDKVLIYTNAKKAVLYDPMANKIVEVAPLNIGTTPATTGSTTTPTPATTIPPKK